MNYPVPKKHEATLLWDTRYRRMRAGEQKLKYVCKKQITITKVLTKSVVQKKSSGQDMYLANQGREMGSGDAVSAVCVQRDR